VSRKQHPFVDAEYVTLDVGGIVNEKRCHDHGEDTRGQVYVEDPPPRQLSVIPSADNRSDDRGQDDAHAENSHGHAVFAPRKGFKQNGLKRGCSPPPPSPCRIRAMIRIWREGAAPHRIELAVKIVREKMR